MQNPSIPTYLFNIYSPPCRPGSLQEAVSPRKGTPVTVVTVSPSTNSANIVTSLPENITLDRYYFLKWGVSMLAAYLLVLLEKYRSSRKVDPVHLALLQALLDMCLMKCWEWLLLEILHCKELWKILPSFILVLLGVYLYLPWTSESLTNTRGSLIGQVEVAEKCSQVSHVTILYYCSDWGIQYDDLYSMEGVWDTECGWMNTKSNDSRNGRVLVISALCL